MIKKTAATGATVFALLIFYSWDYIIPIPPAAPAGAAGTGSLMFATTDSVVRKVEATLVAFYPERLHGWIQDTCIYHVYILFFVCIEAHANLGLSYFVDDNGTLKTCVCSDLMKRSLQSFQYNFCSSLLITFQLVYQLGNRLGSVDVSRSATGYDTLFNSCSCSIQASSIRSFASFIFGLSSSNLHGQQLRRQPI